jgi:hypothetical protein
MMRDFVTTAEMAELGQLAITTFRQYRVEGKYNVPEPDARLGSSCLWKRDVAERWAREHIRNHGKRK